QSKTLADLRRDRRRRTLEQVFDHCLCYCAARRHFVNTSAEDLVYPMDPGRRHDRISNISAKLDLEYSAPLALPRAYAQRACHRKGRGPATRQIPPATSADDESSELPVLVWRSPLLILCTRDEELPRVRMGLCAHYRVLHAHAWQGLLLRSCI